MIITLLLRYINKIAMWSADLKLLIDQNKYLIPTNNKSYLHLTYSF